MTAYENTDKEIWRKIEGEYYSPRIFVTKEGNVGIDVGGNVYVQSVEEWHKQADRIAELEKGEEVAGRFYWESVVDGHVMAVPSEGTPHYNKDDFPLYTTPQIKKLSDEEIEKVFDNTFKVRDFEEAFLKFARAIEERHGIK